MLDLIDRRKVEFNAAYRAIYSSLYPIATKTAKKKQKKKPGKRILSKAIQEEVKKAALVMRLMKKNNKIIMLVEKVSSSTKLEHWLHIWPDAACFSLHAHVDDMRAVTPLLRALAKVGFRADANHSHSMPDSKSASFRLYLIRNDYKLSITGEISLSRGLCKRVQVGTNTQEVPIYEIECPEGVNALTLEE